MKSAKCKMQSVGSENVNHASRHRISRRQFCQAAAGSMGLASMGWPVAAGEQSGFRLRYILASCMYGTTKLAEILPEVKKTGAEHIDIWPRIHGDQREQIKQMGDEAFARLLEANQVKLGMLTHYDLGPFKLEQDLEFAKKFGARLMICGSGGPKNLKGDELKAAVKKFVERMKPHVAAAAEHGVVIGVENHGSALIESPDSLRWLAEFADTRHLGVAMAPYHLPNDAKLLARLIEDLGDGLVHFYAWQHGMGCHKKLPKAEELLQMPGRGTLDFRLIVKALAKINYQGWTEVFMHPVPRGIPIMETTAETTAEINRGREYLEKCVKRV